MTLLGDAAHLMPPGSGRFAADRYLGTGRRVAVGSAHELEVVAAALGRWCLSALLFHGFLVLAVRMMVRVLVLLDAGSDARG